MVIERPDFDYWEKRYRNDPFHGISRSGASARYHIATEREKIRALKCAMAESKLVLANSKILEIGCGAGVITEYCIQQGASHITGVEISETAVKMLSAKFPQHSFVQKAFGYENLGIDSVFDIVLVFDVIHCITDDKAFKKAMADAVAYARGGGG